MRIRLNGVHTSTSATTLRDLLEELGYAEQRIATAVNGVFVTAAERCRRPLREDDCIEIVAPRQGG